MNTITHQTECDEIQSEVDQLLDRAEKAAGIFRTYTTAQVQSIIQAMSQVGREKAEFYAEWSVRETGYGNVNDNIKKNLDCSVGLLERYQAADFIEPVVDFDILPTPRLRYGEGFPNIAIWVRCFFLFLEELYAPQAQAPPTHLA